MDDMEDDGAAAARYHPNQPYSHNHNHQSSASNRRSSKIHIRNSQYPRPIPNRYPDERDDDDIDDDLDDDEDDPDDDVIMQDRYHQHRHPPPQAQAQAQAHRSFPDPENEFQWHPKKRKLKNLDNLAGNYEFAPRVKMTRGGGSEEWSEHAVFVLLEVWGDRFLLNGRRSLRSEDWQEVASKVSESSKAERSEGQCMNMLDRLKRKYKKEKAKIEQMGGGSSKWACYNKMDMLMATNSRQECGLACGVDSGEYVFMNTRVYLDKSNGFDEMRDSPGESETDESDDDGDGDDGNGSNVGDQNGFGAFGGGLEGGSYRVLADSIHKFGEIYESIESSKRQQMMELEKMKREFNREMELQKKQILERAQAEIAKIQEADDNDEDEDEEEEEDNEDDDDQDSDGSGEDLSE